MDKDQLLGAAILLGSLAGIAIYFYLVFVSVWTALVVQVSAFLAVAAVLFIAAWVGYTLATTLAPPPLEDLDLEKAEEKPVEEKK